MADKQVYQSGQLTLQTPDKGVGTEGLFMELFGNLSVQGDVFIQGDTIQIDDVVSFSIADAYTIMNFGEGGPGVVSTTTNNRSGIIIDRGIYSLIDDPDNPGTLIVEREGGDPSGAPIYRDDPAAQSIIDGDGNPISPGSYTSNPYSGLIWDESLFSWDLNSPAANRVDQNNNPLPNLVLPVNPRILNLGFPIDDVNRSVATNVGYVLDKDAIIQADLDAVKDYLNYSVSKTHNHIMYWNSSSGKWDARIMDITLDTTPVLGGNLDVNTYSITTSVVDADINIIPNGDGDVVIGGSGDGVIASEDGNSLEIHADTGLLFTSLSDLTVTTGTTVDINGIIWPLADGTSDQVLLTDGSGNLYFRTIIEQTTSAGNGLTSTTVDDNVALSVGKGTGIIVNTNSISVDLGTSSTQAAYGNHIHANATTSVHGFMSSTDKTKLDSISTSSQNNSGNNVGTGTGLIYRGKTGSVLDFRNIISGNNVTVTTVGNDIRIDSDDAPAAPVSSVTAGSGLTQNSSTGTITLNVGAGDGITIDANTVSHSETSTQVSVDNTNGNVIQDVTLDGFGHITGLASVNLDGRYYTETESDNKYALNILQVLAGNGLTGGGSLTSNMTINVVASTGIVASADSIYLDTTHTRNVSHSSVSISAGDGLTGGGTIASNRTIAVGAGTGIIVNTDSISVDLGTSSTQAAYGNHTHSNATTSVHGFMSSTDKTKLDSISSSSQNNSGTNIGTGTGSVYSGKTGSVLQFRKILAGSNIAISTTGNNVVINATNIPTVPVTSVSAGSGLTQLSSTGDVTLNVGSGDGIIVNPTYIELDTDHTDTLYLSKTGTSSDSDKLNGQSASYYAKSSTSISAGDGLTGGGNLTTNRTIRVVGGTGITANSDDVALDTTHTRNVSHSSVSISAGDGLTGGGTIASNRTIAVDSTVVRTNAVNVTFTGDVTAASFNTTSAMKYKEEIMPFENALEKIMMIDVFTYQSKSDETKKRRLGVSAESMAKVAPELVVFKDGEPDAVNYSQGFALLVQAMQEREKNKPINMIKRAFKKVLSALGI